MQLVLPLTACGQVMLCLLVQALPNVPNSKRASGKRSLSAKINEHQVKTRTRDKPKVSPLARKEGNSKV